MTTALADTRKIKYIATVNDEALPESTDPDWVMEYIDIGNVEAGAGVTGTAVYRFEDAPSRARRRVRHGDVIVSTVRTYLQAIAAIIDPPANLIVSTGFAVIRPLLDKLNPGFCRYALRESSFLAEVERRSVGVSYPAINSSDLAAIPIPFPPLPRQRAIAAFLDRETAKIDAMIAAKERLLTLLAEKRRALITHAVTRGLNPDAPMRDSGVEWLGEIPECWAVGNIRRFATMKTGHTPSRSKPEYWQDCTIPWFTLADVWQLRDGRRKYLEETKEKISEVGLANSAAELLPAGTVVFSRTASVGFSGIMPTSMATSQDFWNWICSPRMVPDYLLYLFRAMTQEFAARTMGSTHKTIYQPIAAGLTISVPPIDEQEAIVHFIESRVGSIDVATDESKKSINLLRERRSALIAAAVTGQIDVEDAA